MSRSALNQRVALIVAISALILVLVPVLGCGQSSDGAEPDGPMLGSDTPVVLVVLDELPSANLMTRDGKAVNGRRYPNIADFAADSTWYRDNIAAGDFTAWAVPPILTGNRADEQTLPTAAVQPDNLFTLLGPGREMHVMETVTELCPKSLCPDGHQGEAADERFADDFIKAKFHPFTPAETNEWIRTLPAGPGTLSFGHVESPHQPLRYTPDGKVYGSGPLAMPTDLKLNGWTTGEPAVAFVQQRHLIQTGYADRIVGNIMRKIKRNGDYDRAMIVLTADHGNSFDPDDLRRDVTATNPGATVNPPLFIKYPGEEKGEVSTASTQSIDILPTIAEELGAAIPETEGKPVGEAAPDRVVTVSKDVMREISFTTDQMRADRRGVLADQYRRLGDGDLWHLGPRAGLIGDRVGRTSRSRTGRYVLENPPRALRNADATDHRVPALVYGTVTGLPAGTVVALAWNGRIAGTSRIFEFRDRNNFGVMVPPSLMRKGKNRIRLYEVGPRNRLKRLSSP